jgi:hypothetical protein
MKPQIILLITALLSFSSLAAANDKENAEVLALIKNFYSWVLVNEKNVSRLEPKIVNISGSNRFLLDTTNLSKFSSAFLSSGYFANGFQSHLELYYLRYKKEFEGYPPKEFDDLAKYGRGPLMEVEDMDIYFCAQEYEYKTEFVRGMKIKSLSLKGDNAIAVVLSPYDWETTFQLTNVNGKWLISGYCVFQ